MARVDAGTASEPARTYLLVAGAWLLVTGVIGFALDASFPTSSRAVPDDGAMILGILETNGWHNLAALAVAVPALVVALVRPEGAVALAALAGAANTVVFVAFAIWPPSTFWVASNGADQVVHALVGAGGLAAAAVTLRRRRARPR